MSKKDAKSKPAKGKDKKRVVDAAPNLDTIREETAKATAEGASIVEALNEAHAAIDKVVIDTLVRSSEGSVEFAGFVRRIENIDHEVEVGREAIAAAEQKEAAFEHLTETAMHLRDQYGYNETLTAVADLFLHVRSFGSPYSPTDPPSDQPLGGWAGGMPS